MALKQLKTKFKNLNKTQQKFVRYVMIIKVAVLLVGICILVLAWKYFMQ